jgi:hypothetical protein
VAGVSVSVFAPSATPPLPASERIDVPPFLRLEISNVPLSTTWLEFEMLPSELKKGGNDALARVSCAPGLMVVPYKYSCEQNA